MLVNCGYEWNNNNVNLYHAADHNNVFVGQYQNGLRPGIDL